jgi:hypothetical protein
MTMRQYTQFAQWVLTAGLLLALTTTAWGQGYGGGGGGGGGLGGGGGGGFGGGGLGGGGGGGLGGGMGGGLGGGMGGSSMSGLSGGGLSTSGLGQTSVSLPGFSSGTSTTGRTPSRSGGSGSISNTNPFSSYYVNPLSMGLGTTSGRGGGGFTSPLYGNTSTATTGTATLSGSGYNSNTQVGGTSMGMNRQMYGVNMGTPAQAAGGLVQARSDLQNVITRSSSLPSKGNIQVFMDGDVVVLRGTVQDDHERRLAEMLVRFTPGVRELRNELTPRQAPQGAGLTP